MCIAAVPQTALELDLDYVSFPGKSDLHEAFSKFMSLWSKSPFSVTVHLPAPAVVFKPRFTNLYSLLAICFKLC